MEKKIRVLLLYLAFMVISTGYVHANTSFEIHVTVGDANESGYFEAAVSITGNPGIAGYNLLLEFDNTKLTPVSISEGYALSGMAFISNVSGATGERLAELNAVTAVWVSAENDSGNGVIYTVLFRAAPDAAGTTTLNLVSRDIANADEQAIEAILVGTAINFGGDAVILGEELSEQGEQSGEGLDITVIIVAGVLMAVGALAAFFVIKKMMSRRNNLNRNNHGSPNNRYQNRGLDAK